MTKASFLFIILFSSLGFAQVTLQADGEGNTYELITSVLAPGYNPIEAPDCSHPEFGNHIDEVFDLELNAFAFRFHIHVSPDNDRCINFDRQRNEIKSYDQSPDNLLGYENETVVYKWKFKLPLGFQSSPNFTHIHQLKSVGGEFADAPMYTLTTRKSSPDRIELRYAETDTQMTLIQANLAPFIGTWLSVTETIKYGTAGTYSIEIKRMSDELVLLAYSNQSIVNWRPAGDFVRPKWGIYRSLINAQDLRDEQVLFADFSIEEVENLSNVILEEKREAFRIVQNPVEDKIYVKNIPLETTFIQIFALDGTKITDINLFNETEVVIDVSKLSSASYFINFQGKNLNMSKKFVILK
jgi:hypothetical protein